MHVVIVGGGIGGLTLAHGLLRQGISVEVYERDRFAGSRFEGYRIDIEEMGLRALHACLPPKGWAEILEVSYADDRMTFLTAQMKTLLTVDGSLLWPRNNPTGGHYGVDRPVLRRVLQSGLERVLHFDAEFVRYERGLDGRVTALFADGRRATGDILVGADGTTSRVGAQYLPGGELVDLGVTCVGVKLPLNNETRAWLPESLSNGVAIVNSDNTVFSFNAVFDPTTKGPGIESYILHAFSWDVEAEDGADPAGKDDAEVIAMVADRIASWHPIFRRILGESTLPITFQLRASKPRPPWKPSPVVLLGDALHAMPPTAGRGGNTALRDAHLLARELWAVATDRKNLVDAIGTYEVDVRSYSAETIAESVNNIRAYASYSPIRNCLNRAFLRTCSLIKPLRERVFAGPRGSGAMRPWENDQLPGTDYSKAA
jgi:2-polyprenyl-6-methoxyphenol hydroxylase-like FAD-dependent oxidoreductase